MEEAVGHKAPRFLPWAVPESQLLYTRKKAPNRNAVSLTWNSVDATAHARIGDPVAKAVVADRSGVFYSRPSRLKDAAPASMTVELVSLPPLDLHCRKGQTCLARMRPGYCDFDWTAAVKQRGGWAAVWEEGERWGMDSIDRGCGRRA